MYLLPKEFLLVVAEDPLTAAGPSTTPPKTVQLTPLKAVRTLMKSPELAAPVNTPVVSVETPVKSTRSVQVVRTPLKKIRTPDKRVRTPDKRLRTPSKMIRTPTKTAMSRGSVRTLMRPIRTLSNRTPTKMKARADQTDSSCFITISAESQDEVALVSPPSAASDDHGDSSLSHNLSEDNSSILVQHESASMAAYALCTPTKDDPCDFLDITFN